MANVTQWLIAKQRSRSFSNRFLTYEFLYRLPVVTFALRRTIYPQYTRHSHRRQMDSTQHCSVTSQDAKLSLAQPTVPYCIRTLLRSRDVIAHVTIWYIPCHFLLVVPWKLEASISITVSEIFNVKSNAMVDMTLIRPLNKGHGHSFWYQSISHIRLPIGW